MQGVRQVWRVASAVGCLILPPWTKFLNEGLVFMASISILSSLPCPSLSFSLQVGTLDTLVALSDQLQKLDPFVEK